MAGVLIASLSLVMFTVDVAPAGTCYPNTNMPSGNPNPPAVAGTNSLVTFSTGSLIIPMDGCYQRPSFLNTSELNVIVGTSAGAEKCNSDSEKDDGIIPAYSLMFRLIEAGIHVHWSIKAGKTGWNDTDFTITKAAGAPVSHIKPGGTEDTTKYTALTAIKYRGAPFIIDSADAAAAMVIINGWAGTCESGTCFDEVDIHIAQADFDAPIKNEIEALPKIAMIDVSDSGTALSNEKTGFMRASIDEALMAGLEGIVFEWVTIPEVNAGDLLSDGYQLAWVPPFELTDGVAPTAAQTTFLSNLDSFADAGGAILFQDGAVSAIEGYGDWSPGYDEKLAPTSGYMTVGGIHANGSTSSWDNGNADEKTVGDDYSDPASQFGGLFWTGIGGSKFNWTPRCDNAYADGVRRMIYTEHQTDSTKSDWDMASWRKKDNDPAKGTIYYLGGSNWRRVTAAGFRVLLNSVLAESDGLVAGPDVESIRSAPIIATVEGIFTKFQGTFETNTTVSSAPTYASTADDVSFKFPHVQGHYRALDLAKVAAAGGATTIDDLIAADPTALIFDAADKLTFMTVNTNAQGCTFPADATCRRIFTNDGTEDPYPITRGNQATLQPLLGLSSAAEANYMIDRIHEGVDDGFGGIQAGLGGIDRSTAAIIESSTAVGGTRPTIAYVGGTDGMMHAFCADSVGACAGNVGNELWAFMPRTELDKVRLNEARIDGSPKVADVFGDFNGDGNNGYKTVLTFQTGNLGSAATYALDITDPTDPKILWENTTTGGGTTLAMASIVVPGEGLVHVTYSHSSTVGWAGMEVIATRTQDGTVLWSWSTAYEAVRDTATGAIPEEGFPGGVSAFSAANDELVDTILVPTLWGSVYSLSAGGDTSSPGDPLFNNGGNPIFVFDRGPGVAQKEDYHPIGASLSIYSSKTTGTLHAVAVTGGFTIHPETGMSAASWSPSDQNQYAIGFPVEPGSEIDEDNALIDFTIDFGQGNRAFSQAVIAGDEIFVTTDSGNVNAANYGTSGSTALLHQANLSGNAGAGTATGSVAISSGAGGLDVRASDGAVYTGDGVQKIDAPRGDYDATGTSIQAGSDGEASRYLWLSSK